jgi:hypothetical protein
MTMLEGYFPSITHNENRETANFSGLRYIENTNPNTFLSLSLIDVDTGDYDFETLLTDYKTLFELNKDHAYLATNAYEFDSTSEVFEMQNPISATHTILSDFTFKNDEILLSKTRQKENMTPSFDSLIDTGSGVVALLRSETEHHLLRFDESMEETDELTWPFSRTYQKMRHVDGSLYLYEERVPIKEIRLSNSEMINPNDPDFQKASIYSLHPLEASPMKLVLIEKEGSLMFEILSDEDVVVDEFIIEDSSVSPYLDRHSVQKSTNEDTFFIPYIALKTSSNTIEEDKIMVLNVRDEREIMAEAFIEMKNIPNPKVPFVYRHLSIEGEAFHITPSGVFVTSGSANEVTRKLRIE